jgi:cathepsin A (carboxypeptidase C)
VPSYADAQAAFSQKPFLGVSEDLFEGTAMGWMGDAEKAILRSKENLERWNHEGKEFIKQDNLLCENHWHLFANILGADIR